ncbi:MAG: hypothetical protein CMB56_005450 [Methanobacteriota archaeon]|nr:MAG: hypothetical protein CMB56_005450 [Euryarchaeota archaeon]|tara:strand:+ start:9900 stop:10619 length:720 start_codon:yes stop_codon:yes gene_type:complete
MNNNYFSDEISELCMGSGHFVFEAEEMYLQKLYEFWEKDNEKPVRTKDLAVSLSIKDASATGMIQKLSDKGLVSYEKYKGVQFTDEGFKIGRQIKRRHRLIECLLIDVMGFKGDAHEAACRMEHAIDDELEIRLNELLGNPKNDPSGSPIPPPKDDLKRNEINEHPEVFVLNSMKSSQKGQICAIMFNDNKSKLISEMGLELGSKIEKIGEKYKINDSEWLKFDSFIGNRILVRVNPEF